ncbi:MAG: DUF3794 domain-containing protein [Bacillota bacterium]
MIPTSWYRLRVERTAGLRPVAKDVLSVTAIPGPLHAQDGDGLLTLTCLVQQVIMYTTPQGQQVTRREAVPCGITLPWSHSPGWTQPWTAHVEKCGFWLERLPERDYGDRLEIELELVFTQPLAPYPACPAPVQAGGSPVRAEFTAIWADRVVSRQKPHLRVPAALVPSRPLERVVRRHDRVEIVRAEVTDGGVLVQGVITTVLQYEAEGGVVVSDSCTADFVHLVETGADGSAAQVRGRVVPGSPVYVEGQGTRVEFWHVVELETVVLDRAFLEVLTGVSGRAVATGSTVVEARQVVGSGRAVGLVELACDLQPRAGQLVEIQRAATPAGAHVVPGKVVVSADVNSHVHYVDEQGVEHYAVARGRGTVTVAVPGATPGMEPVLSVSASEGEESLSAGRDWFADRAVLEATVSVLEPRQVRLITGVTGEGISFRTELLRMEMPVARGHAGLLQTCIMEFDRPPRQVVQAEVEADTVHAQALDGKVLCQGVLSVHVYYVDNEGNEQYRGQALPFYVMVDALGCRASMEARARVVPDQHPLRETEDAGETLTLKAAVDVVVEVSEVVEVPVITAVMG